MRRASGWTGAPSILQRTVTTAARRQCPLTSRQLHSQPTLRRIPRTSLVPRSHLRHASSETAKQEFVGDARSAVTRLKNLFYGTSIALFLTFSYLYITDTRASVHQWLVVPAIRALYPDAEDAHHAGTKSLKALYTFGLHPRERGEPDAKGDLKVEVFGHILDNPIGTSAGIDKGAEVATPLLALGPGVVEVGGVTPLPQEGNPKPRVWRIPSQNALINRYGLNSEGADNVATRLRHRVRQFAYSIGLGLDPEAERQVLDGEAGVPPGSLIPGRLLAVQVAKMKGTPDNDIEAVARDYVYCVEQLSKYADILVVNVSSPNTPGLRSLQASAPLTAILTSVVNAAKATDRKTKPAVMVKVSPDEDSDEQVRDICGAIWASGVDGVIVGNTTKKRPDPLPKGYALPAKEEQILLEQGGYSGPQLFERTVALVKKYRRALDQGPGDAAPANPQEPAAAPQQEPPKPESEPTSAIPDVTAERIQASVARDAERLKPQTPEAEAESKQPLVRLPERNSPSTPSSVSEALQAPEPALSSSHHAAQGTQSTGASTSSSPSDAAFGQKEKVIFATGGITNGKQALEVLNAGASVAMVCPNVFEEARPYMY